MNYNKVIIAGNLTRPIELKYMPNGKAIANLSVAINKQWKDESGTKKEKVTFVECLAFGRTAEILSQYFQSGQPVMLEGELSMDEWQDKSTGQKRTKLKVLVSGFTFLPGNKSQDTAPRQTVVEDMKQGAPAPAPETPEEDEVPF